MRAHLLAVARGGAPADRLIHGARVINVYSGEILDSNVAISGGRIAYVGPRRLAARDVLDATGLYLTPGWIELSVPVENWLFRNFDASA